MMVKGRGRSREHAIGENDEERGRPSYTAR